MNKNNNSQFSPLHHRLAYIDASLRHACNSMTAVQELLDSDRDADGALAAELFNLDRTLTQLERHMKKHSPTVAQADTDSADDDIGADSAAEKELLLRALDAQEARIRQLEAEISSLRKQDEKLRHQSEGEDETPPDIMSNAPLQSESTASRMIVTMQDGGNLKVGLSAGITTIGREPANDLQIRSRFVSRFHARIVSGQDGAVIEDLDSRNGVTVNADRVSRRQLRSGDYIRIGRIQLQYIDMLESSFGGGA